MKIILSILLTLFAFQCYGFTPAIQATINAVSACSAATNEVGDRSDFTGETNLGIASGRMICLAYTADCSGTLAYAYYQRVGTANHEAMVCVYNRTDTSAPFAPAAEDTKVACSAEMGGGGTTLTWEKSPDKLGGSVTSGNPYWVCVVGGEDGLDIAKSDDAAFGVSLEHTSYSKLGMAYPPDTLATGFTGTAERDYGMYVEIE